MGVYLGHSSQHSPTVSLILNPQTGLVSPQFHCVYDENFDSPRQDKNFSSVVEEKAGLKKQTIGSKIGVRNYLEKSIPCNLTYPFTAEEVIENATNHSQEEGEKISPPDEQQNNDGATTRSEANTMTSRIGITTPINVLCGNCPPSNRYTGQTA